MSKRSTLGFLSAVVAYAMSALSLPREVVKRGHATMIPRNHAARATRSRRSAQHTRPALPIGTRENARRVRQMARGILRVTTG